MSKPLLITTAAQLDATVQRARRAARIAFDSEGNGLHAYRCKLCVLQLAWHEADELIVAIVDPLDLDIAPLAELLGPSGPAKVIHDLTFDARMLHEAGMTVGNVRDTSVAARFLGEPSTGLAALVKAHFGIAMSKRLQEHDCAVRPFTPAHLDYLASDVSHLLALDELLSERACAADIEEEVHEECQYKLLTASRPPKDQRPAWLRIKGAGKLDPEAQAILHSLVQQRSAIAERLDRPPFKIASNHLLLDIAKRRPRSESSLRRQFGRNRSAARWARHWAAAVRTGLDSEPPRDQPAAPGPTMSKQQISTRKRLDTALNRWRRAEATDRGVDVQVILPGHCVSGVVAALAEHAADAGAVANALERVEGLGRKRLDHYVKAWRQLAATACAAP